MLYIKEFSQYTYSRSKVSWIEMAKADCFTKRKKETCEKCGSVFLYMLRVVFVLYMIEYHSEDHEIKKYTLLCDCRHFSVRDGLRSSLLFYLPCINFLHLEISGVVTAEMFRHM